MISDNKKIIIVCIGLLSFAAYLWISQDAKKPGKKIFPLDQECSGVVKIQIGPHTLNVPRKYARYAQLETGDMVSLCARLGPNFIALNEIRLIKDPWIKIILDENLPFIETTYDDDEVFIKRELDVDGETKVKIVELLEYKGNNDLILLPQKESPTADGKPVAISCRTRDEGFQEQKRVLSFCRTRYKHPSGLFLGYNFNRAKMTNFELIEFDQKKRKILEDMMVD